MSDLGAAPEGRVAFFLLGKAWMRRGNRELHFERTDAFRFLGYLARNAARPWATNPERAKAAAIDAEYFGGPSQEQRYFFVKALKGANKSKYPLFVGWGLGEVLDSPRGVLQLLPGKVWVDADAFHTERELARTASTPLERARHSLRAVGLYRGDFLEQFALRRFEDTWLADTRETLKRQYGETLVGLAEAAHALEWPPEFVAACRDCAEHHLLLPETRLGEAKERLRALHWNIPEQQNRFFGGRDETLEALGRAFFEAGEKTIWLCALGGCGKTQTARAFAQRYAGRYEAGFWMDAGDGDKLQRSFDAIADLWELPARHARDGRQRREAVLREMRVRSGWLCIFDNADMGLGEAAEVLGPFLPEGHGGHILITSRQQSAPHGLPVSRVSPLPRFSPEAALAFLFHRLDRRPEEASEDEQEIAARIAAEADCLPLALEVLGATMQAHSLVSFREFYEEYLHAGGESAGLAPPETGDYNKPLAEVWKIHMEGFPPVTQDLMRFSAFLDPDFIPRTLILGSAEAVGSRLSRTLSARKNPIIAYNELLAPVAQVGLLAKSEEGYALHRTVQSLLRARMDSRQRGYWKRRVTEAISALFPPPTFENWKTCEALAAHARLCRTYIRDAALRSGETARLLGRLGRYLHNRGRYEDVEALLGEALAILEATPEAGAAEKIEALNNLAFHHYIRVRFEKAEPLYDQALRLCDEALGPRHLTTANTLHNLAMLRYGQYRYGQAVSLFKRALRLREAQLGAEHPDTLTTRAFLGQALNDWGKPDQAAPHIEEALRRREEILEADHPDLARSRADMARLLMSRKDHAGARSVLSAALDAVERKVGLYHHRTAMILGVQADLEEEAGRFEECIRVNEQIVEIFTSIHGPDYRGIAFAHESIARAAQALGRGERARRAGAEAKRIRGLYQAKNTASPSGNT